MKEQIADFLEWLTEEKRCTVSKLQETGVYNFELVSISLHEFKRLPEQYIEWKKEHVNDHGSASEGITKGG